METTATTHVAEEHHEPTSFGLNAEQWVYVGLLIFILLAIFVLKAPKLIAGILDERIAAVKKQLDDAKAIRADAEALLADAKRRQSEAASDVAAIMAQAKAEAAQLVDQAQADATALVARRTRMAEDKIAAAERTATADLRARAADLAAKAARTVIAAQSDAATQSKLTDAAISDLGARLN